MISFRPGPQSPAVTAFLHDGWGEIAVLHDRQWRLAELDALVAEEDGAVVGAAAVAVRGDLLEMVSCDARPAGRGIGRALVDAVLVHARARGLNTVAVSTTNDNLPALGLYQACGFTLARLWPDAVAVARRTKPAIPAYGHRGLPIRDELDLEYRL